MDKGNGREPNVDRSWIENKKNKEEGRKSN